VADTIVEVNGGAATMFRGDFEYYAAKRGLDIEVRGATEGIATPRGIEAAAPKPRESAQAAAARKRAEAEDRNRRYRATRDLRKKADALAREADATASELERLAERLADPTTYADHVAARDLIERHNRLRDRAEALVTERAELANRLQEAEGPALVASE
jgi:ATP-binding cassette subfamily F protein 3